MRAAIDANCLGAQSTPVYWTYVDYLHSHGQEVNGEDRDAAKSFAALDRIALQEATIAKLDAPQLESCIAKQDETQAKASSHEAENLSVNATPAIFAEAKRIEGFLPEQQ